MAAALTASVWDTPYISGDLLKHNMTCITFGQPHVSINVIQWVARRRPEMVETINAIFVEEDQIPRLMGLLDECWSQKAQQSQNTSMLEGHRLSIPVHQDKLVVNSCHYESCSHLFI